MKSENNQKYVYFVSAFHMVQCGYFKVGITSNYKTRLQQIQSGSPFKIIAISIVTHSNPIYLEQAVLEEFKTYRIRGEWFCVYGDNIKDQSIEFEKQVKAYMEENADGNIIK